MTGLVTLTEARARVRFDSEDSGGSPDDGDLQIMINSASRSVLRYIASGDQDFLDSNGDVIENSAGEPVGIPDDIKDAVLLWVAIKYRNRDEDGDIDQEFGFPPKQVVSILYSYRQPTLS